MSNLVHNVDLFWALLGLAAGAYPAVRLGEHLHRRSSRDFFTLCLILATYPTALAVFHLTPFDLGLVYSSTVFLPVLYFLAMVRYLGVNLPGYPYWRLGLLGFSGVLSLLALTNVWHAGFATFQQHTPNLPNHLLDDLAPGIGMGLMQALAVLTVLGTMVLAAIQFLRSQVYPTQVLLGIVLPGLALLSFTATQRNPTLAHWELSGFILTTSIVLLLANYALARNHFIELRVVTRSRMMAMLPDAMVMISAKGKIVDCNPAFANLRHLAQPGFSESALLTAAVAGGSGIKQPMLSSQDSAALLGEDLAQQLPELSQALAEEQASSFQLTLSPPVQSAAWATGATTSQTRYYQVTSTKLGGASKKAGSQQLLVLRDISAQTQLMQTLQNKERELQQANARLLQLSITDALTGLYNRRYFKDQLTAQLEQWARSGDTFGLLMIDLDFFKQVNDTYGHQAGDQVLCQVARMLEVHCRSADILARVGGEEFAVLMRQADNHTIATAAERFRQAIAEQVIRLDSGLKVTATVSIGGCLVEPQDSMSHLLERADQALYQAKQAGRNQTVAV